MGTTEKWRNFSRKSTTKDDSKDTSSDSLNATQPASSDTAEKWRNFSRKTTAQPSPATDKTGTQQQTTQQQTNAGATDGRTLPAERGSKHKTNRANQQRREQAKVVRNVLAERRSNTDDRYSVGKGLGGAAMKGINSAAQGIASTLAFAEDIVSAPFELLTGQNLGDFSDTAPLNRLNQRIKDEGKEIEEKYAENVERGGKGAEILDKYGSMTVAAVPQAAAALFSGGASAAGEIAAATNGLAGTVRTAISQMAKDPQYWLAFTQAVGTGYDSALEDMKDVDNTEARTKAALFAVGNGLMNAAVEVGGGIQKLPEQLKHGAAAWKSWLESALDEGKEEVVQGVIERALQNFTYSKGNTPVSLTDEDAVLSLPAALEEFTGGAVVGGILGAGQVGVSSIANRIAESSAREAALQRLMREQNTPAVAPESAQERAETPQGETTLPTTENAPAAQETDGLELLRRAAEELNDGKRVNLADYATPENMSDISQGLNDGTLAVDALDRIYRTNESEHIDQRNSADMGSRTVNAFQFDHPELHQYYRETASELLDELGYSEKGGEIVHRTSRDAGDDEYFRTKRVATERIAQLLDGEGISYADIEKALNAIINNHGQENFAAAKRVELLLDDMLSNGYRSIYGETVAPNEDYIAAKQAIPGADTAETTREELPIWDMAEPEETVSRETVARNIAQVRDAATALGQNGSRALSTVYNETNAGNYAPETAVKDFYQVYNAALEGGSDNNTTAPDYIRMAAQNAGERDARIATQAKYFGKDAQLVRDEKWRKAKLTSKESYALDALAKVTGTQIRFADTVAEGRANANYSDGVITLALDAENPVMTSVVHETVHRIREAAPEMYQELSRFVLSNMSDTGLSFNQAVREEGYGADVDTLNEEIVADAFGVMLENSGVLEQFATQHRSAAQKLMDALHDLVVKIERALGSKEVRLSDNQKAAFRDLQGKVSEMETLFAGALETTREKAGSKNAANLTGSRYNDTILDDKYSMKEDIDNEREERADKGAYGNRYENWQGSKREGDRGVRGGISNAAGRYGRVEPSFGEKPYFNWAESGIVQPQHGSVASESQKMAMDYGIPSFVVSDAVWDANYKGSPAFSVRGQIYFRENMPEKNRGMLAPHEITHVMRQTGYQPYLDFIKRTPDMLNLSDDVTKILLEHTAKHQNTTVEKADLMRLYDEFNATVYGHIAANKADMFTSGVASNVFRDFAAYSSELAAIHEQFKQDRNSGGEERIRTKKLSLKTDSSYLAAVQSGDTATAQKMVDEAAKTAGYTIRAYHGTARADRVGTVFRPDRATSGPMAFFTSSKEIAQNYARDKADTSIAYDTEYDDYYTQFRVTRGGKSLSVGDLWGKLTLTERAKIKEAAPHIRFDEDYDQIVYDPTAQHGNGAYDAYELNRNKGNVLNTLVRTWLETGDLYGRESDFLDVLKLAGVKDAEYRNPDARSEKVYDTYLKIQQPFDTATVDKAFYNDLSSWLAETDIGQYQKDNAGADMWDKNAVTPERFLERLSDDIEAGTSHAWTSIPDYVTAYLQERGYDGIKDTGGKGGGEPHTVWIPFSSEQVKSAEPVVYDDNGGVIPLSERFDESDPDIRHSLKTREALDEYIAQYGEIPAGETPHRRISIPRRTAENKYVSQTIRTVLEAKATPEAMIPTLEDMVAKGAFSYDRYTDKQAVSDAESKIKTRGWQKTLNQWKKTTKEEVSKEAMATGWALYNNAATSGDVETALEVLNDMVAKSRNAAQALQAVRLLKKQEPSTQLYGVQRSVESLQEDIKKRYGENAPELEVNRELAEKFLNAKTDEARTKAMGEIYRDIGRQMPSRFIDRWNAWRYLAMLGNLRTHARNIVGNAGFAPLVGIKNLIGTGLESAANAASGGKVGRTKSALPGMALSNVLNEDKPIFVGTKSAKALLEAAWNDYANIAEQALGEGKYNESATMKKEIEEGRKIFGNTGNQLWDSTAGKGLEAFRRVNGAALDAEDMWFSKPHYAAALAMYCKANGITAEQITSGKGLEAARNYAIKEAQKATYRDTNDFSQMVSELGRYHGDSKAKKMVSVLLEGILPFRKTPANILARGVEYSPLGLTKAIVYDSFQVKQGKMEASEMLDHLSTGLTGTGVLALGVYMAKEGLLRGSGGDDEDKKDFDALRGHQDYALELADGTSVTLDWLAPEVLPLFVGANLYEQMQSNRNGEMTMSDVLEAVSNISDPLLEMSCLQSLNDLFDSVGYASSGDTSALASVAASAATSYLTQAIPTVFGQIERTGEDLRMTTYTDKNNKNLTGDMQYTLGKASAKIPGVEYNQIPYIDAWGRTESTGNIAQRAANNFFNPAYVSTVESSAMETELERLYEATGEAGVFPERADKYITVNGERKYLTGEEYVKYATEKGQTAYKAVSEIVKSEAYRALSDEDKAKLIGNAYSLANAAAKMSVSDYTPSGGVEKGAVVCRDYGIDPAQYIMLYAEQSGIESLKDSKGETISLSQGLLKMELIYQQSGLSDKQRAALFEAFNVPESIRHYNKALVAEKLKTMRRKAK